MSTEAWTVSPELIADFSDLAATMKFPGELINENWMSRLTRVQIDTEAYFVKAYASRGRGLRRFLGRSRIRAEWENLLLFDRLGIPTAEVVAYGEGTVDKHYAGVLVTREVRETRDLASLQETSHAVLKDHHWRRTVIRRLSRAVHTMHLSGFVHNDLKWRNILVEINQDPGVYVIDCPLGRGLRGPFLRRGIIKDLACLDKVGKRALSRTDRLRFYLAARGKKGLDASARREIRKILVFFEGRE